MTWVKICGTTNLTDAEISVEAGADALGFIFAPSARSISVETAAGIVAAVGNRVETIGVFVNEAPDRVAEIARQVGLSGVQLHGDEPATGWPEFTRKSGKLKVIKAFSANGLPPIAELIAQVLPAASTWLDAVLLDSGSSQQRGGTGVPFDWERTRPLAAAIRNKLPLIVAGGLNPQNVSRAIELFEPWGVDVVSGVEREPGKKDEAKVREFVSAARAQAAKQ